MRKKNLVRNGRGHGTNQYNQYGDMLAKGNLGLLGPLNKDEGPRNPDSSHDSHRKAPNAELEGRKSANLSKEGEIHTQNGSEGNLKNLMDISSPPLSSEKDGSDMTTSCLSEPSRSKKLARTKNTKAFKRSSSNAASKTSLLLRTSETISENGVILTITNNSPSHGIGNVAQGLNNSNPRRSYSTNSSLLHRHNGLVRGGASDRMEASVSNHFNQPQN